MSCFCFSCVDTGRVGVKQWCGAYSGTQEPGCSIILWPFTTVRSVSLASRVMECSSDCKTKDNVTLSVITSIQYNIAKDDVEQAVFHIADPERQMRAYVDSVVRSTLPELNLDEAYAAKEKMVSNILESVKKSMEPFGYTVLNVLITDLRPEASVLRAMNDINASRRQREAAYEKGEAEKVLLIKAAEADAESKRLTGVGIAKMRLAMAEGFKNSIDMMGQSGLQPPEAMHMMMMTQYVDALKDFATHGNSSVMLPSGPGAVKDLESQVRDGFLASSSLFSQKGK